MPHRVEQPPTEVWRDENGLIYIKQMADLPYSDEASVIVIHPLVVPQIITWLQELLTETPAPEA